MQKKLAVALIGTCTALLPVSSVHADWLQDTVWDQCSPDSQNAIVDAHRAQIEEHVRRAEASIAPPTPIGDLSCLTDLMSEPLDFFSSGAGLLGSFGDLFNSFANMGLDTLSIDGVNQMICDFAEDKWRDATASLTGMSMQEITGISLDPTFSDAGGLIPGFGGSFFNLPDGNSSVTGGYSGPPSAEMPIEDDPAEEEVVDAAPSTEELEDMELAALQALQSNFQSQLNITEENLRREIRRQINAANQP